MRPPTPARDPAARLILRTTEPERSTHRYGSGLAEGFSSPAGLHRRPWLARLRRALREDLFAVHYQPIVSIADGRPAHYEALVRLADEPAGSLVAPGRFLPAAERYGLVRDIDRLVLARVATLLGSRTQGPRVAINLSALSVTDPAMLNHVERCLCEHGADPGRLVIEITETAAISDMDRARTFCRGLAALGCEVALDDFGAGYGSFHYLTQLPFDYLKIDGSFVRELTGSRNDQLVVQALVGLARGMGVRTIAEYVTDRPTLTLLRRYGVDYAQGFELGRPHPRFPLADQTPSERPAR
ncbi:MAG TPA: EAL domain-containing protein [Solirubrobacteraceae bacterium]|jgi:EAL domain-containing protein (putative c-di-GMP-specific phosphodiesterase class I)